MVAHKYFLLLLFLLIGVIRTSFANPIDSLLNELEIASSQNDHSNLPFLHFQISELYRKNRDHAKVLSFAENGLAQKGISKKTEIYFYLTLNAGIAHKSLANYDASLEYFYKIIDSEIELPNAILAMAHKHVGEIFQSLGDHQKSYQSTLDALHYHTLEKDSLGIGTDYYVIGSLFFYQDRFEQALEYLEKAKTIYLAINNKFAIYDTYAGIGGAYMELGNLEKSYEYGSQALEMAKSLNYSIGIAYSLGNLAEVHLAKDEMVKAKEMLEESLRIKKEQNDKWGVIGAHHGLANACLKMGRPKETLPHLDIALQLSEEMGSSTRILESYRLYEKTHKALNNFPKAYSFLEKYTNLRDSVLNEKTLEEMGQAKKRFELEKKESEIALLQSQNDVLEQGKQIQKLQTFLFLFLAIILFISFWFVKSRLKLQKKTNHLLEGKNKEIQTQNTALHNAQEQLVRFNSLLESNNEELASKNKEIQTQYTALEEAKEKLVEFNALLENNNTELASKNEEIESVNLQLKSSNEDLESFAYVASHDLKEPLRMISTYTKMLTKRYNDKFDDTGREFMFFVSDASKRMTKLLDDLLNYSKVGKGGRPNDDVNINDVLSLVRNNLYTRLHDENGKIEVREENIPIVKSNQTQMVQIFQNVISNALKFRGERDPIVIVDCQVKDGMNIFSIQDNGIGIAPENQQKVFEMFNRLHTKQEYEGTGIGLATCKKIVANHEGEIWLESEYGVGTTFFFSMPVMKEVAAEVVG